MKQRKFALLSVALVIVMVTLACGFSFGDTGSGVTATPESNTAAAAEPATQAPNAPDFFTEEFDGNVDLWTKNVSTNGDSNGGSTDEGHVYQQDGKLVFELGKYLIAYAFYDPYNYSDVRMDVVVENRGVNDNAFSLVCRDSSEGNYTIDISNSGLITLYAYEPNKGYKKLADGGSKKIKSGKAVNVYTMICKDRDITLLVNDTKWKTYTDNDYVFREGQVGMGATSWGQVPVKLEVDSFKISQP